MCTRTTTWGLYVYMTLYSVCVHTHAHVSHLYNNYMFTYTVLIFFSAFLQSFKQLSGGRLWQVTCQLHTYHYMEKSDASAMYLASIPQRPTHQTLQQQHRLRKCAACKKLLRHLDIHLRKTHAMSREDAATMLQTEKEHHRQEMR